MSQAGRLSLRSPPFAHIRTWGFGADARSGQGRARFLRVHRSEAKTLDGEDGRISWFARERGHSGVVVRSLRGN